MTKTATPWPVEAERRKLRPIQQLTGEMIQRRWQVGVPVTLMTEVDASGLLARHRELKDAGRRSSITSVIAARLSRVLARHPTVNCRLDEDTVVSWTSVNLGIAISIGGNDLVVGVVRGADSCDESEMSARIAALQVKADGANLRQDDVAGAAVTLSSVGMMIGDVVGTPIIPPNQTAVVLVSGVTEKAVVRDGAVVARPMLPVSLTVDHRIVNGAAMSAFLKDLCSEFESC